MIKNGKEQESAAARLGDFTTSPRVMILSVLAIGIGIVSGYVALVLLKLIGLFTNLFFYQRWDTALVSPAGHHLGYGVVHRAGDWSPSSSSASSSSAA